MFFEKSINGISVESKIIKTIADNISNASTYGFKSSNIFTRNIASPNHNCDSGESSETSKLIQNFKEGEIDKTDRKLDVFIKGSGFFRLLNRKGDVFYSRNGRFFLNKNKNIVNNEGLFLTGYSDRFKIDNFLDPKKKPPVKFQLDKYTTSAYKKTNLVKFAAIFSNSEKIIKNYEDDLKKNIVNYNKKYNILVYDSSGKEYKKEIFFTKIKEDQWKVFSIDPIKKEIENLTTITFTKNGNINNTEKKIPMLIYNKKNKKKEYFNIDISHFKQKNIKKTFFSNSLQDGYPKGEMETCEIDQDGGVVVHYNNNKKLVIGKIVLSNFHNTDGLLPIGKTTWIATKNSGPEHCQFPGDYNYSKLIPGALEKSNVDIGKELIKMIIAQRNFQSNAQVIKIQDKMFNTIINI